LQPHHSLERAGKHQDYILTLPRKSRTRATNFYLAPAQCLACGAGLGFENQSPAQLRLAQFAALELNTSEPINDEEL
jgi:hypothetical protein